MLLNRWVKLLTSVNKRETWESPRMGVTEECGSDSASIPKPSTIVRMWFRPPNPIDNFCEVAVNSRQ